MLFGKSGAGKSSSGNTILNRTAFNSDMRLKRVTVNCEKEVGQVEDRPVAIIDTPGLFEKDRNKEEIFQEILMRCSGGFHVFNNKTPEDQTQVTSLMEKIQTLMALNGGGHYRTEFYPRKERKIRTRQESILAEGAASILKKEEDLRTNFKGEELKTKLKELWKKEDERTRKAAENQIGKMRVLNFLLLVMSIIVACSFTVSSMFMLTAAVIWIGLFLLKYQSSSGKMPFFLKNK
ncbi:GTPase IMAP family member 5 [Oryzias melastigma]|uniref:GTPase IMAP family member 5 n=1 Tax=Oryzias melastigma TaxID=30732 RepID=A0A834BLB2_ORYME|nr:GTPase IMAP family member 5 [Oryzias melastigma]